MSSGLSLCIFLFVAAATCSQAAKVTPMEKVISLLKDLTAKVSAEGAKEAAEYDKFACFCKEQADQKLYSIEKSDNKLADLKAQIEALRTSISDLESDITGLSKTITTKESIIEVKTKHRAADRADYEAKAQDMNEAIASCEAAIEALKDSKSDLKDAKVDLLQLTSGIVNAVTRQPAMSEAANKVALLSKLNAKQAPKFEYQSNDIIAALQDLLATFNRLKRKLDFAEHDSNSVFEKTRLGLSNEVKFAKKEKAEKETIVEGKNEDLNAASSDRDEEQTDRNADDTFMKELGRECEKRAAQFDQRSATRSAELSALTKATEELLAGAVPNFSATRQLLQTKATSSPLSKPVTFVQVHNVRHGRSAKEAVLQNVRDSLNGAAGRTGSRLLSTIAARVDLSEDHFVKVRELIKDLVEKLKSDALSEAQQKGTCDSGIATAVSHRDSANLKIEAANAKITTLTAKKDALEDEIETLNGNIADLKKGFLEGTELRAEEKADNTKSWRMTKEGAEATKLAMSILKNFYEKAAFVQTEKWTPPDADRDGNRVGDLAPKVNFNSGKYTGADAEAKGIVSILEVLLSDFERQNRQEEREERAAKMEFQAFEQETNDKISNKNKRIEKADEQLAEVKSGLLDQQQAMADAQDLLESATESLENLQAMCVKGEETWEERKKKREEEIAALKEAIEILDNWQN